jgi:hypothetical protein
MGIQGIGRLTPGKNKFVAFLFPARRYNADLEIVIKRTI